MVLAQKNRETLLLYDDSWTLEHVLEGKGIEKFMLKVFICSQNYELLAQLILIQRQKQDFLIQGFSSKALIDPLLLAKDEINVLYLQFSQIKTCWQRWFDTIYPLLSKYGIRLVISFSCLHEESVLLLLRYSIDAYLLEPFDGRRLYETLCKQQHFELEQQRIQNDLDTHVTALLLKLMIPSHLNGFHYLKMACLIVVTIPTSRQIIMKNIYSMIAKRCHSTSSRVEKCIRSAIHAAPIPADYHEIFHGEATNRKVIMYVYTCLKGIS